MDDFPTVDTWPDPYTGEAAGAQRKTSLTYLQQAVFLNELQAILNSRGRVGNERTINDVILLIDAWIV